jgi:DNA modification methylase
MGDATIGDCRLMLGDCLERLRELPDASVDCVVTDPPYPCIKRRYGTFSEPEWHKLMRAVVAECRRVLTPAGSAVFVLQPNCKHFGEMRLWFWEFVVWAGRSWNLVQDVYWWNTTALPKGPSIPGRGLPRPSVKPCVWLGAPDCHRDVNAVLKPLSHAVRYADPARQHVSAAPSGGRGGVKPIFQNRQKMHRTALARGGSTPFNCLPIPNSDHEHSAGAHGHGAGTPYDLCHWWIRFLCPEDGTVLDPFLGSGTTALAAIDLGRKAIGIERDPGYFDTARRRIRERHEERAGLLFG